MLWGNSSELYELETKNMQLNKHNELKLQCIL